MNAFAIWRMQKGGKRFATKDLWPLAIRKSPVGNGIGNGNENGKGWANWA